MWQPAWTQAYSAYFPFHVCAVAGEVANVLCLYSVALCSLFVWFQRAGEHTVYDPEHELPVDYMCVHCTGQTNVGQQDPEPETQGRARQTSEATTTFSTQPEACMPPYQVTGPPSHSTQQDHHHQPNTGVDPANGGHLYIMQPGQLQTMELLSTHHQRA